MTVHHQADAEEAVKEWVAAGARGEGGNGHRDEAGGEQALKRPVVGSMGLGGRREGGRVVHSSLVNRCLRSESEGPVQSLMLLTSTRHIRIVGDASSLRASSTRYMVYVLRGSVETAFVQGILACGENGVNIWARETLSMSPNDAP